MLTCLDTCFNYYYILGVEEDVGAADIERAFAVARERPLKWWQRPFSRYLEHLIATAYFTLSTPRLRAEHDRMLAFRRESLPQPPV